jgi:hypothetical protein
MLRLQEFQIIETPIQNISNRHWFWMNLGAWAKEKIN